MALRLTLRTLLAYRDGSLPESEREGLAQKIEESPSAQGLLTRLDAVQNLKRFSKSRLKRPKLDANDLAGYLDDLLTPEVVTKVEAVLMDDDFHLSEVLACHEILNEHHRLSQADTSPALSGALRDRLYELTDPPKEIETPPLPIAKSNRRDRSRPSSHGRQWLPATIGIMLVLLLLIGTALFTQATTPSNVPDPKSVVLGESNNNESSAKKNEPNSTPDNKEDSLKKNHKSDKETTKETEPPKQAVSDDDTPAVKKDDPAKKEEKPNNPNGNPPAWVEPKLKLVLPTNFYPEPAFAVDAFVPVASYTSAQGLFFRQSHLGTARLQTGDPIFADEDLVSPIGSQAEIQLVQGATITLMPNTRCRFLLDKKNDLVVRLDSGGFALQTFGKSLTLSIQFQGRSYQVQIPKEQTLIEFDCRLSYPPTAEKSPLQDATFERLLLAYVAKGKANFVDGITNVSELGEQNQQLVGDDGRWITDRTLGKPVTSLTLDEKTSTKRAVILDHELPAGDAAIPRLRKLSETPSVDVHPLAELTLADLGDDVFIWNLFSLSDQTKQRDRLLELLVKSMRYQLHMKNGREEDLNKRLRDLDSADRMHWIILLKGFEPPQFSNLQAKQYLVELLMSDRRALRWLAWWNLKALAGNQVAYHPDASVAQRQFAANEWKKALKLP